MARESAKPDPRRLLKTALNLAEGHVPILPCVPGGKRPLTARGDLDATTDTAQILAWWDATPTANVAMLTGRPWFDVLDVDVRPTGTGFPALWRMAEAGLTDAHGMEVLTPSGGAHLYFAGTQQANGRLAGEHLRFKSSGGYVLVPPSVVDDVQYRLTYRNTARAIGPLDWSAVREFLRQEPVQARFPLAAHRASVDLNALSHWVSHLPQGHRRAGLFWAAHQAAETSISLPPRKIDAYLRAELRAGLGRGSAAGRREQGCDHAGRGPSLNTGKP